MMRVSVVVPVYNWAPHAVELFEKLFLEGAARACPKGSELIVIDDRSPLEEETRRAVERFSGGSDVKYTANASNLGFVKSCNAGLKMAGGDVVLLVNSDVRLPRGSVERLARRLEEDPKAGMAGPVTNNAANFVPQQLNGFPPLASLDDSELERVESYAERVRAGLEGTWDVPWLIGCCVLIRRELIDEIGLLDEGFGLGYFEEVDYGFRAREKGRGLLVDRGTFVYHGGAGRPAAAVRGLRGAAGRLVEGMRWSSQSMRAKPVRAGLAVLKSAWRIGRKHGWGKISRHAKECEGMSNPEVNP